jgi:hypothetical protein
VALTVTHHGGGDATFWTSRTVGYTKSLAAGTIVTVCGALDSGVGNAPVVTDTKGNKFVVKSNFDGPVGSRFTEVFLARCVIAAGKDVTTSDSVTISIVGTDGPISVDSFEGLHNPSLQPAAGNPLGNPDNNSSFGTSWTSAPLTMGAAGDLMVAVTTTGSASTAVDGVEVAGSESIGVNRGMVVQYREATGAGAMTVGGTLAAGNNWVTVAVGYKPNVGLAPPDNDVLPAITGITQTGRLLTCTSGSWTPSTGVTFAYQWTRNGANIVGAVTSTYTLQVADEGAAIGCTITATNTGGSTAIPSDPVSPTAPPTSRVLVRRSGVWVEKPVKVRTLGDWKW